MRVWLVGAGYWGEKIASTLKDLGVESTIIDVRNGSTIDDINTLDPVILATPVSDHYSTAKILLERGHDLYVEKPLTETKEQALDLKNSMQGDQILMVGYIFLYHQHCNMLKEAIKENVLGDIKHIHVERMNWGIYRTDSSPLLNLVPHDISIVQYLLDNNLHRTKVTTYNLSNNPNQYDKIHIEGNCGSTTIQIDSSWYSPIRRRIVTVIGTKGCAIWDTDKETLIITDHKKQSESKLNNLINYETTEYNDTTPLYNELEHFIICIKTRQQPRTDINQAIAVARTIDQIADVTIPSR